MESVLALFQGRFVTSLVKNKMTQQLKMLLTCQNAEFNLFSITKRPNKGYKLRGDSNLIWIEKDGNKLIFDIKIVTLKGAIFARYFKRKLVDQSEVTAIMTDKKKGISAAVAHGLLGHVSNADGRKTIAYLGFKLNQKAFTVCGACAAAKAKQQSLPRAEKRQSQKWGMSRRLQRV